jgi:hypothetical protein
MFLKFQEDFSEHEIRVFLEKGLEASRNFLFYRFETNQMCEKHFKNLFVN